MKCGQCGKRLKKSDEICPECGKYIVRKKSEETETAPEVFVSADPVCNENEIVFKDNIPMLIFKLVFATLPILACIISFSRNILFYDGTDVISDTFLIIIGILLYIDAFAVFFRERGCKLTFESDYFHGTVPIKFAGKQEISIRYDDIAATDLFEGSKNQSPCLKVFLKSGDPVKIICSRKQTLCEIEQRLKGKPASENSAQIGESVVFIGETVEGSLTKGNVYTIISISENGMYEITDESGENKFFCPEWFGRFD